MVVDVSCERASSSKVAKVAKVAIERCVDCYGKVAQCVPPLRILGVVRFDFEEVVVSSSSRGGGVEEPRAMPDRRIGVRRGQTAQVEFNAG